MTSHGGLKIGDIVTWAGERCRVTGVYDGCDEIVIEQLDEPGGFDVLWWSVQRVPETRKADDENDYRREQAEEELECAHMSLDKLGAPRERGGEKLSLVGRIYAAVEAAI